MATATQAEQFVALDSDMAGAFADAVGATQSFMDDDLCEVTFPDGSQASTTGGAWRACGLTRAETLGVAPELWDHGTQADMDECEPRGWTHIEAGLEA
jgi:hypothetical protein